MKRKHLSLAIAAVLAAGGLWFAWSAWRAPALHKSNMSVEPLSEKVDVAMKSPRGPEHREMNPRPERDHPNTGPMLNPPAPPVPNRRFTDFTPEQRVQFARQGHGPGG